MAESPTPPYPQTPVLETNVAVAVLIANVLIPGVGTLVAGIVGHQKLIGRAIVQFLLWFVIVGWVWAIVTGVQALTNASWSSKQAATPAAVAAPKKTGAKKAPAKKTAPKKGAKTTK